MRRLFTALAIAGVLVGMLAAPASAGEPTRDRFIDTFEFDMDCGSFTLHETVTDRITVLEWFNASGEFVMAQVKHSWTGMISGPGGVLELSDPGHWTDFIGPTSFTQVGLVYNIHVPGLGAIVKDAGSIEFDDLTGEVTIHGPHEAFEAGVEPLICPYFE